MSVIQIFEKLSLSTLNRRQVLVGLSILALAACSPGGSSTSSPKPTDSDVDYYTCPMHPQVHVHDAHSPCPFCGMDLVPVKKSSAASTNAAPAQPSTSGSTNS